MRFSRVEVVFHRLKIRTNTANVAEVNVEKLREVSRRLQLSSREQSFLRTFLVPSLEGDSEVGDDEPFRKSTDYVGTPQNA
ncbi:hypothetical protein E2C01_058308 [Portunus trituberculatus]|uniref:Uncharacterized protein n=1 Tax=Portunus trituberculatus TaxID=210409 RepID=A0A5B7H4D0_PORTR|nr:hypothetical protein [Portunus trituberculatus]